MTGVVALGLERKRGRGGEERGDEAMRTGDELKEVRIFTAY